VVPSQSSPRQRPRRPPRAGLVPLRGHERELVAALGPGRGSAAVYVDGKYRATISLASTTYRARQVVYATSWSTSGVHTLRIVNLGTAGHPRVDVDAFVQLTTS
jgi:hypothetical protein